MDTKIKGNEEVFLSKHLKTIIIFYFSPTLRALR